MSQDGLGVGIHKRDPLLVVISGPSGVGKDTVVQQMKARDLPFHFVVTATSRPPRPEEVHGKDYIFVSEEEFQRMIAADELLEHAIVYDQHKGIPREQVREALASGSDVIMRLDVQGAATIRKLSPDAILIFIAPANEEELIKRLKSRKTESEEDLQVRLETARKEYQQISDFDYEVINRDFKLDEAVDIILAIIRAEHHSVVPRKVNL